MKHISFFIKLSLFGFLYLQVFVLAYSQTAYPDERIFTFKDTTKCLGDKFVLKAYGATGNYKWAGGGIIANPDSQFTSVSFEKYGSYRFVVSGNVNLNNIAYDGQFERFDPRTNLDIRTYPPSFETTYGNTTVTKGMPYITNNNQFLVDTVVRAWSIDNISCPNPDFRRKPDPGTGTFVSRGKFLYADANASGFEPQYSAAYGASHYLWQLSNRKVKPNTTYTFSVDLAEWNMSTPPDVMLLVNGQPLQLFMDGNAVTSIVKPYFTLPSGFPVNYSCKWMTVKGMWNSGNNTTATITIAEVAKTSMGHEIALDDISFSSGMGTMFDTLYVTVKDCFVTGLENNETSVRKIYPNPSEGIIRAFIEGSGHLTICNSLGVPVYENEIVSEQDTDVSFLPKGIYFYKLSSGSTLLKGQLVLR